jgi:hypothetical protein
MADRSCDVAAMGGQIGIALCYCGIALDAASYIVGGMKLLYQQVLDRKREAGGWSAMPGQGLNAE